jgi:hypothetical protein
MQPFDVLMAETMLTMVAAPLAAVAVRTLRPVAAAIVLATALSMLGHWAAAGAAAPPLLPLLAVHATLGAAALALAAIGACARTFFTDPLDAGAAAVATAAIAGAGVFALGPAAIDLPERILNLALAASPIVAVASAANVDLFRGEMLYHLSPIAHRQFEYPLWYAAAGSYLVVAAAAVGAAAGIRRTSAIPSNNSLYRG